MYAGRARATGISLWPSQRLWAPRTGNCGLRQTSSTCSILLISRTPAQRLGPATLAWSAVLGCRRGTFNLDSNFCSECVFVGRRVPDRYGTPSLGKPGQCGAVHVEGAPEDKWWGDHTARRLLKWGAALPA